VTTARDVIVSALRLIHVLGAGDPVAAHDEEIGLERLNDMLASWATKGVDIGHYPLTINQTFPLEERHVRGAKALLAAELAPDFGKSVTDAVALAARDGWLAIQAEYVLPDDATFDAGIVRTPARKWIATG
jgi:hypothetical protein